MTLVHFIDWMGVNRGGGGGGGGGGGFVLLLFCGIFCKGARFVSFVPFGPLL